MFLHNKTNVYDMVIQTSMSYIKVSNDPAFLYKYYIQRLLERERERERERGRERTETTTTRTVKKNVNIDLVRFFVMCFPTHQFY